MGNTFLYIAWGVLYGVCAGLGLISGAEGAARVLMILFGLLFFVPPFLLLRQAGRQGNRKALKLIRGLSLAWLIVTPVLIIVNILSVSFSALAGTVLYYLLVLLTAPMVCGQIPIVSIFLWAILMAASWMKLSKKPK